MVSKATHFNRRWTRLHAAIIALALLLAIGVAVSTTSAQGETKCWRAKPARIETEYEKRYAGQAKDHNITYSETQFTLQASGKSNTISWGKPPDRICEGAAFPLSIQSSSGEGALVLGRFEVTGRCNTVSGDLFKGVASWGDPSNPAFAPRQNTTVLTCTRLENIWVGAGSWGGTGNIPYADVRVTWEYEPEPEVALATATRVRTATPTVTPTPQPDIDLSIDHIEVTQAIQDVENNVPLVADRTTLVRVFIKVTGKPTGPIAGITISACGMGSPFRGMTDTCVPAANKNTPFTAPLNPQRATITDTLNLFLPNAMTYASAGPTYGTTYPLELWINPLKTIPETNYDNNRSSIQLTFTPQKRLSVGYLRVGYQPPGQAAATYPSVAVSSYITLTQKLFPLSDKGIDYYPIPVSRPVTGTLVGANQNVTDRLGLEFIVRLRKAYDNFTGIKPDQLVAWLPNIPGARSGWSDPKWGTSPDGSKGHGRVTWAIDANWTNPQVTLAHEMSHNFGLRHSVKTLGNDAPTGGCGARPVNPEWPYATTTIQEYGFDSIDRRIIPNTWYDVMTYCWPPTHNVWIAPHSFTRLYNSALRPRAAAPAPSRYLASIWGDSSLFFSAALAQTRPEQLIVSGSAKRDGSSGRLDPAYHSADYDPGDSFSSSGNHCLRLSGASGVLATFCFDLEFTNHYTGDPLDEEPFAVKVPFPADTTRVALVRDNRELATLTASPSAPTLSITSPRAGDTWQGQQTIAWTGADADGGALTYTVLYTPDGGKSWYPIELDTTNPQLTLNTSEIAGGDQVFIRVLASDGLNTTKAEVGPIKVLGGIPPATSVPQPPPSVPQLPPSDPTTVMLALILCGGIPCLALAGLIGGVVVFTRSRLR